MLEIGDDAVEALREIGALRITGAEVDEGEVELEIAAAEQPIADDRLVERDGVAVYLDELAANVLDDQVLHAEQHGDHYHFGFEEQAEA